MPGDLFAGLLLATIGLAGFGLLTLRRRLQTETAARRTAETRLRTLVEHAPIGLALIGHDGTIRHANIYCRQLLGYEPESMRTVQDWRQHAFPDADKREAAAAAARDMVDQARASGVDSAAQEFSVARSDGSARMIRFQYVHFDEVGLWTLTDVTDHYRTEEAARLANDHLLDQLSENRRLHDALREQAVRDPLTGLFNRRYLDETLQREVSRAMREGYPVAVMMIDIDHFKRINDTYGHLAGDEMLKSLAVMLHGSARHEDILCRFGGEEFAVVLPRMPVDVARARAETWRTSFAETTVRFGEFELKATLSLGLAAFPGCGATRDELIEAADQALYRAKELGRNRVQIATTDAV